MPIIELFRLPETVGQGQRVFGLDVGKRRLGVAMSDVSWMIASPLALIDRTRLSRDLEALGKLATTHGVGAAIIGLPIEMSGAEGPACQSIRQFGANITERLDIPVSFWDERLSTTAVERVLVEAADLSRKRRAKVIDRAAATYILQGALDALLSRGNTC